MISASEQLSSNVNWPPQGGEIVSFTSSSGGHETAVLKEVRWGLVWRDFILDDGRVIPEHRVSGCPQPPEWRKISDVSERERQECEELLVSMATSGMDPRKRDQWFWAELNQYLAFIYIKYKQAAKGTAGEERTFT